MIVRYWMTPAPTTAHPDDTLLRAVQTMRRERVRRLPVVDSAARLVGILSDSDLLPLLGPHLLRSSDPLPADLVELLEGAKLEQWMTANPETCTPNDALEEVGERLMARKVGALPVVHEAALVGIITESDIFKAFTRVARGGSDTRRLCLLVPHAERPELIRRLVEMAHEDSVDVHVVLCHPTDRIGEQLVMVRVGGAKVEKLIDRLWRSRVQVLQVV